MVRKLHNFDDWIDYFRYWQDSIGLPQGDLRKYGFEAKFGDPEVPHIEFGHYKGQRKWPTVMHIPDQRIRDALLNLIVYQGDTEFASVEQQRNLLQHAPSDYDLLSLQRVMTEEMRHGWQMSYLLCTHFGDEGKREAAKLLERRADEGERLLGSFNEIVDNWLDFFTYTQFIDRDGKFQLKMLSVSAFDPLSRSMGPMLKEESFHLGTGNNGLLRIVKAGKMPAETIQRFFYKWVPTAFDLFGNDNSSSAHWAYVWGLKGRYDERENAQEPDKAKLNEYARELYRQEIVKLVERLNMFIPERERWLKVPELKFNRKIGVYAHQMYTVDGEPIDSKERYAAYLKTVLPQARDYEVVKDIEREPDWIEAKKADSLLKQWAARSSSPTAARRATKSRIPSPRSAPRPAWAPTASSWTCTPPPTALRSSTTTRRSAGRTTSPTSARDSSRDSALRTARRFRPWHRRSTPRGACSRSSWR